MGIARWRDAGASLWRLRRMSAADRDELALMTLAMQRLRPEERDDDDTVIREMEALEANPSLAGTLNVEDLARTAGMMRKVGHYDQAAAYDRAAECARQQRPSARPPSRPARTSLRPTRSRESRPQRRHHTRASGAASRDGPEPDLEPDLDEPANGGRLGVGASR